MNFYNEFDPKAAGWLRELIVAGEIPMGTVDERNIAEIKPSDLAGFKQCHFFAGIGGWSQALRLAGWSFDRPVWTASLPCQPFSTSGQSKGVEDERHLWPFFFNLVKICRPDVIFGEQVARAIGFNWLDGISADLEKEDYSVGQAVLGAHSVGAPHKRQRLYWLGVSNSSGWKSRRTSASSAGYGHSTESTSCDGLAVANVQGSGLENDLESRQEMVLPRIDANGATGSLAHSGHSERCSEQWNELRERYSGSGKSGPWSDYDLIYFKDDKFRRVEAGTFPLADGVPGRVGLLRGYGNAIVPPLAAEFIKASEAAIEESAA